MIIKIKRPKDISFFIDFDGVITSYNREDYKYKRWLRHPEILCKEPVIKSIPEDWIILSKVSTVEEAILKAIHVRKLFPKNKFIPIPHNMSKAKYAKGNILLDDWNVNLEEWKAAGGIPVKILNGINSPRDDIRCIPQMESIRSEFITHDDGTHSVLFHSDYEWHRLYLEGGECDVVFTELSVDA